MSIKKVRIVFSYPGAAVGLTIFNLDSLCYEVYLGSDYARTHGDGWDDYCQRKAPHLTSLRIGTDGLDASAIVSVASTDKGVLLPRMNTAARNTIQVPVTAEGLTIFNTDSHCYQVYIGKGQAQADALGWDDYCVQTYYDSLLIGQGKLGSSAVLEVKSTSKGVLFPRMATA